MRGYALILLSGLLLSMSGGLRVTQGGQLLASEQCTKETTTACYFQNKAITFTDDASIQVTDKDLIFESVTITCRKEQNQKGDPCNIYLQIQSSGRYSTSFKFTQSSTVSAQSLVIDGALSTLYVDTTSLISGDGMSISTSGSNVN